MENIKSWLEQAIAPIDTEIQQQARQRQEQLTKPAGSLGKLEHLAVRLAGMQSNITPSLENVHITVYAADHGVAAEGVSAFPQAVTMEMVRNFAHGGAAISVMARQLNANLQVVNVGTISSLEPLPNVTDMRIAAGTANLLNQAAMSAEQCEKALLIGRNNVQQAKQDNADIYIAGDMGIGNTTSATALAAALLVLPATTLTGPGTGLDNQGIQHKAQLITQAIQTHQSHLTDPYTILQYLGGFEIAAMVGSYLECAKSGIPVIIDGFISSSAALIAEHLCPGSKDWFIFSHASAEPGHQLIVQALQVIPILDLHMRLGEASGAAALVPLLRMSCSLHNQMATFEEAAVSAKQHV